MRKDRLIVKPLLFPARAAHRNGRVAFGRNGVAQVRLSPGEIKRVPPERQYDLTQATIFGLNERLTMSSTSPRLKGGGTLRDRFNAEWQKYALATDRFAHTGIFDYGVYAYYARSGDLVRYCDPYWHRVVSVATNSMLVRDPSRHLSWEEIRRIFSRATVAVAGGSVGSNALHNIAMDIRPDRIKIADKSVYKMENINRIRVGYEDIVLPIAGGRSEIGSSLRNKAIACAEQLYRIDPFIDIYVYPEGITPSNIDVFLGGRGKEPPADILVEEVDDPRIKIVLREEARRRRIPLLMVSDLGSMVQLDVLRYDRDPRLPLTYGTPDAELRRAMEAVYDNPGDREIFFAFVDKLIGRAYRRDELREIVRGAGEIPTSTIIPQLGSTAAVAGGVIAEAVARILLGADYPPRAVFDKRDFRCVVSGGRRTSARGRRGV